MPLAIIVGITCVLLGMGIGFLLGTYIQGIRTQQAATQRELDFVQDRSLLEKNLLGKISIMEVNNKDLLNQVEFTQQMLERQKTDSADALKQMSLKFENLAQKIFEDKSTKFNEMQNQSLSQILNPLREKIRDFEKKVEDNYLNEKTERNMLRGELNKLIDLNKVMTHEAEQLTKALKGENKTQGNWGELLLENILEKSGLRKDEEYIMQATYRNEEGQMLRPDVVVKLPENKVLIVDAKMTLNAYEGYSSAEDLDAQEQYAKLHVTSLKNHIDGLAEKKYHLAENILTPDFVILFMPLEPAFALAFKHKPDLFQYAWDRNVAIVSPTTLLTTLRTVAILWRQDRQEKNAFEIAKRAGLLYDKFSGLLKDFSILGEKVYAAHLSYEEVMKKLSHGRGNLIDQVEELKRLGAKTEKSLQLTSLTDAETKPSSKSSPQAASPEVFPSESKSELQT